MFPTFLVMWAITYPTSSGGTPSHQEWVIQDNLPFILYSVLGGLAAVSMPWCSLIGQPHALHI